MGWLSKGKRGLLCLGLVWSCGCAVVGPHSISAGRADYAEAINRTEDEQILLSIVKGRYGETSTLLAVGGVAANIRFSTRATVEAGFGPRDFRGENLLIGGLAYEENPTVTYAPVQGQEYLMQLTSPIPMDLFLRLLRSVTAVDQVLTILVNRVNKLRNPDFMFDFPVDSIERFERFVEVFTSLHNAGVLELLRSAGDDAAFELLISGYAPEHSQEVAAFLELVDFPPPGEDTGDIVIPAYFSIGSASAPGLRITTRSTYDLVEILRASVTVPEEHAGAGLSVMYPPPGLAGRGIQIHCSRERPSRASPVVRYRDHWFYIDEADQNTKAYFNLLRTMWSISIADAVGQGDAPVYTIPLSQ